MLGSLINSYASSNTTKPEVGMGVTFLHWSDRSAGTISDVISDREIKVQGDSAKRIDSNGMSESQTYEFTQNPDAPKATYTLRKNGRWVRKGQDMKNGQRLAIGYRDAYHDFTF